MSTSYPGSLDSFANPVGTDLLENANNALDHDVQHSNANDAIEALEAKVGANNSAVTSSHDYKLSGITGTDKALSSGTGGGAQTISDLTLVDPIITLGGDATGDMFYRDSGGLIARLPIGTTGQIIQAGASGIPEYVANPAASAATYTVSGVSTFDADARYYAADAGANDTYVITLSPAPNAYATGQTFRFKANTANTGAATLNVNGLGAKTIVKGVNTTLADGDIAANQINTVVYDGTNFVLQSPVSTAVTPSFNGLYATGITTYDLSTASGTQTIAHGLSKIPKAIRLVAMYQNSFAVFCFSEGFSTGASDTCDYTYTQTNAAQFQVVTQDTITKIAHVQVDNSGDYQEATCTVDATNITLTWVKTGTPSGTAKLRWIAEA